MIIAKKGGSVFDSELFHSLEKVAQERKLIEPEPLEKKASSPSWKATGDVNRDLITLVAALRDKGYHQEADDLEDKVHLHRMAETDYYRAVGDKSKAMLDLAHPEGDVEVAPSEEGYGKVQTLETSHQSIRDKVEKTPTGKYAQRVQRILKHAMTEGEAFAYINRAVDSAIKNAVRIYTGKGVVLAWGNEAVSWEEAADKLAKEVKDYLYRAVDKRKLNPARIMMSITSHMANNWKQHLVKKYGGKSWLDIKSLWDGWDLPSGFKVKLEGYQEKKEVPSNNFQSKLLSHKGMSKVLSRLNVAIEQLMNLRGLGAGEVHPDNIRIARFLEREARNLNVALHFATSFSELKSSLKKALPEEARWDQVQDITDVIRVVNENVKSTKSWAEALANNKDASYREHFPTLFKESSDSNYQKKIAQRPPPPSSSGKTNKSPGVGRKTVVEIQKALGKLADVVENLGGKEQSIKILRETGSQPNPEQPDGLWGGATRKALEAAEEFRQGHKLSDVPSIAPRPTPNVASNVSALAEALGKLGSKGIKFYGEIYDNKIGPADLNSPKSFYDWLIDSALIQPLYPEGVHVVMVNTLESWIQDVRREARQQVEKAAPGSERKRALDFLRRINLNVLKPWRKILSKHKASLLQQYNETGEPPQLPVKALMGSYSGLERALAPDQDYRGRGRGRGRERGQRGVGPEGRQYSFGPERERYPISEKLNLASPSWNVRDANGDPIEMTIFWEEFDRGSALDLAVQYFGSRVEDYAGRPVDARSYQNYALMLFYDFLKKLSAQISRVSSEWRREVGSDVSEREVLQVSRMARRWQREINNKMRRTYSLLQNMARKR